MTKCFAKMEGGIGNQLFQLAAAFAYARKHGKKLFIDDGEWTASQGKSPKLYRDSLFKNFEFCSSSNLVTEIKEQRFNYNELPYIDGDVALRGYFQSLKYFQEYKDDFIKKLQFPEVNDRFITRDSMSFHIRMGDYKYYPAIFGNNINYFSKAFERYQDEFQINVFTDSPDDVLRIFDKYDFRLIRTSSELNDLTLLSKHDRIVCSNSSFSWWGAILGNPKDLIIVPDKWLLDRDCSDIYYEGMIKYEL